MAALINKPIANDSLQGIAVLNLLVFWIGNDTFCVPFCAKFQEKKCLLINLIEWVERSLFMLFAMPMKL